MYTHQYGIYSSEAFGFSRRILGNYMHLASKTKPTIVVTGDADSMFKHYLFASNSYTRQNAKRIQALFGKPIITVGAITIAQCDTPLTIDPNSTYIVEVGRCEKKFAAPQIPHASIPILSDGGELYKIYGDALCSPYPKKKYPTDILVSDFGIQQLSTQRFCTQFITYPSQVK